MKKKIVEVINVIISGNGNTISDWQNFWQNKQRLRDVNYFYNIK